MYLVKIQMKSKTYTGNNYMNIYILSFSSNFVKFIFVGMGDYDEGEKSTIHFSWFLKQ